MRLFYVPDYITATVIFFGLITLTYFLINSFRFLIYRYVYKKPYMTPEQLKYFILLEENKKLQQKITSLEDENEKIFNSLINKIN